VMVALVMLGACSSKGDTPKAGNDEPAPLPVARTEVAGTVWGGTQVVVLGGLTSDGKASARADVYSPQSNRWVRLPDLPVALHHSAVVDFNARLTVLGGYTVDNGQWRESARVFSFGRGEDAWRDETPLPAPRGAPAAVALPQSNRILVMGGVSHGKVVASTVVFSPGRGWSSGPSFLQPREHLAATVDGNRVYAIGGRSDGVNFKAVESWDGIANAWWQEPKLNDSRGGIGAATILSRPCVVGGEEEAGTIASVECFYGDQWRRVASLQVPRHGLAVAAVTDRLHVIGGGPKPGLFVSTAHEELRLKL
jgi:Galactose oxidase, central domain/Kelch motif